MYKKQTNGLHKMVNIISLQEGSKTKSKTRFHFISFYKSMNRKDVVFFLSPIRLFDIAMYFHTKAMRDRGLNFHLFSMDEGLILNIEY